MARQHDVIVAIAKSIREFGYPVTSEMIGECWDAYESGKDMPHGVIGEFALRSLDEVAEARPDVLKPRTTA